MRTNKEAEAVTVRAKNSQAEREGWTASRARRHSPSVSGGNVFDFLEEVTPS